VGKIVPGTQATWKNRIAGIIFGTATVYMPLADNIINNDTPSNTHTIEYNAGSLDHSLEQNYVS